MELQEFGDSIEEHSNFHVPLFPTPTSFPFVLSFKNLSYSVKVRRKLTVLPRCLRRTCRDGKLPGESTDEDMTRTKVLLNDISGEAREGEIMAVLGSIGSGKSTLIDALADCIGRESLKAEFLLPRTLFWSSKKSRVQALIDQLDLQNAANTMIGDEGHRGVCGRERRRVSIGKGIIHDPILLFLDEPTSGLHSTSAYMVVKVLQRIVQSGSIVIMSIHQPSYRILCLLDHLIFLSCGQIVFGGPPTSIPQFFAELGPQFQKMKIGQRWL